MSSPKRRPCRNAVSRFKGVGRTKNRWRATIVINKCKFNLGSYVNEEDAARAYDEAAALLLGPEAFQNLRDLQSRTEPIVDGAQTRIPLMDGTYVLIDTEDLPRVGAYYWCRHENVISTKENGHFITLHSLLLGKVARGHSFVNLNGDRSDYRKANLAIIPLTLRAGRSRKQQSDCTSTYKGVCFKDGVWHATIGKGGRRIELGTFNNEIDAARTYDEAARRQYGMFAALNFPREGEVSCLTREPVQRAA